MSGRRLLWKDLAETVEKQTRAEKRKSCATTKTCGPRIVEEVRLGHGSREDLDRRRNQRATKRAKNTEVEDRSKFLERRTVSRPTERSYHLAVEKWEAWRAERAPRRRSTVDHALAEYMNELYFLGEGIASGRNVLFGYLYSRTDEPGNKNGTLPAASRALRGWEKVAPGGTRDPLPFGVLCVMVLDMIEHNDGWAATAAIIQFDVYARPSEILDLMHSDLLAPQPRAGPLFAKAWAIVIGSSVTGRPTKTGQVDNTVLVGELARPWMIRIVAALARVECKSYLFPLTLGEYEGAFRRCAARLSLQGLEPTPHTLRHGGPSHDVWVGARDLHQVQKRGHWAAFASVSRYEKHARLLRQIAKTPNEVKKRFVEAERLVPSAVIAFLKSSGKQKRKSA